jgi:hypothetical protein
MLLPFFSRVLRLASLAACAIAVLYFLAFTLDQTDSASSHQQAELSEAPPPGGDSTQPAKSQSGLHEALDETFGKLASPFSGVVSDTSSAWTLHIVDTLLVLLVYGFGLGFLSRLLKLAPQ